MEHILRFMIIVKVVRLLCIESVPRIDSIFQENKIGNIDTSHLLIQARLIAKHLLSSS